MKKTNCWNDTIQGSRSCVQVQRFQSPTNLWWRREIWQRAQGVRNGQLGAPQRHTIFPKFHLTSVKSMSSKFRQLLSINATQLITFSIKHQSKVCSKSARSRRVEITYDFDSLNDVRHVGKRYAQSLPRFVEVWVRDSWVDATFILCKLCLEYSYWLRPWTFWSQSSLDLVSIVRSVLPTRFNSPGLGLSTTHHNIRTASNRDTRTRTFDLVGFSRRHFLSHLCRV